MLELGRRWRSARRRSEATVEADDRVAAALRTQVWPGDVLDAKTCGVATRPRGSRILVERRLVDIPGLFHLGGVRECGASLAAARPGGTRCGRRTGSPS